MAIAWSAIGAKRSLRMSADASFSHVSALLMRGNVLRLDPRGARQWNPLGERRRRSAASDPPGACSSAAAALQRLDRVEQRLVMRFEVVAPAAFRSLDGCSGVPVVPCSRTIAEAIEADVEQLRQQFRAAAAAVPSRDEPPALCGSVRLIGARCAAPEALDLLARSTLPTSC